MTTPSDGPIRVYIVEDVKLLRLDMTYALGDMDGMAVVGAAGSAEEALQDIPDKDPQVVLMDIGLPGINGIEGARRLTEAHPRIRIIMLTAHDDDEEVLLALNSGASAYVVKGIYTDRLAQVIQTVHEGASWLDPKVARVIMNLFKQAPDNVWSVLAEEELQTLAQIAEDQVAQEDQSALHPITCSVSQILHKLQSLVGYRTENKLGSNP